MNCDQHAAATMFDDPRARRGITRRALLGMAALGTLLGPIGRRKALASPETAAAALRAIVAGAPLREGKVHVDIPPIAENGNSVPLVVTVESPMTEADHVRSIHVIAEKNPLPNVANFYLGPRAGKAQVSTRIRLFTSQKLTVVVALSDASFWSGEAEIYVTLGACLEE